MSTTMLKIHVEKPGTDYRHQDGSVVPSSAGHVWMELIYVDGTGYQ